MQCKTCRKLVVGIHRKFCSKECYWKSLEGIKGKNAPNYRRVVGKSQVHKWLDTHYGKPSICESKTCDKKTVKRWFDWALKTGKTYERNRNNFFRLCRSCHRRYDLTPEKKEQAIKNLIKHNPYGNKNSYKRYLEQGV